MATLQGLRQRTWPTWGDQEEWVEVQSILHQLWHFVQVKTIFGKQGEQAALPQCDRLMFKNCCMHGNTFQSRRRFAYCSNCNRVVKVKANDRHWGGHRSSCYTCPLPPAWEPWCIFFVQTNPTRKTVHWYLRSLLMSLEKTDILIFSLFVP